MVRISVEFYANHAGPPIIMKPDHIAFGIKIVEMVDLRNFI